MIFSALESETFRSCRYHHILNELQVISRISSPLSPLTFETVPVSMLCVPCLGALGNVAICPSQVLKIIFEKESLKDTLAAQTLDIPMATHTLAAWLRGLRG